jgi:hypothetical protein
VVAKHALREDPFRPTPNSRKCGSGSGQRPDDWGIFEYSIAIILAIYFIRGFLKSTGRSVLSLVLFPITVICYVLLPIFLGYNVIILENFLGLIKLFFYKLYYCDNR